ncbi:MAG: alanine racemase [Candidatus Hodarchaeota archaeon]
MDKEWYEMVSTPSLIVHQEKMMRNIETMAKVARDGKVNLRPHVKTHKCPEIAKLQLEAGAGGICVAAVGEAEVFASHGCDDILIANQVVETHKMQRMIDLAGKVKLRACVDSVKNIKDLNALANKAGIKLEVLLDIDVGMGRTGVLPGAPSLEMANFVKDAPFLELVGFQVYEGHLNYLLDFDEKKTQTHDCMKLVVDTRDLLNDNDFEIDYITASGTSTSSISSQYPGITEIQPGTYIFSDVHTQDRCPEYEIALTILSTVNNKVGKNMYTLDMGSKSVATADGKPELRDYPSSKMQMLNEEHGQFRAKKGDTFEIGQKIELVPAHVCPTCNLYDHYNVIKDGEFIGKWNIEARGKNY